MSKFKTFEEATAALETAKSELKTAKDAKRDYLTENGIKKGKTPDEKHVKKLEKMDATIDSLNEKVEGIREAAKELKPKKVRTTKYEYPEGMTDDEKKKFRAKARRAAKGEDEPEEGEKKAKKVKKEETEEPAEKSEKKPLKKVVKKEKEEDED